jgi:BNR repeat-like domain
MPQVVPSDSDEALMIPMRNYALSIVFIAGGFAQTLIPVTSPAPAASIQANWATAADGRAILSWVAPGAAGSSNLQYAIRRGSQWSDVKTIASNRHFFRHPAELPELVSLNDGTLIAHWVENGNGDSDAEYIFVSTSHDGAHWTAPSMAHRDKSAVEHGLASIVASGPAEASILWLQALHGEDGPVSLMRTVVGADGKEIREEEIDKDVCSCCPTSVVRTAKGLLVAYRGHTPQDVRDIAVRRLEGAKWSPLKIVNADNWRINACPINAAVAAAKDDRVAVAWYTAADNSPRVELAFSTDAGATFAKPVKVSTSRASGYASTLLASDGGALVSWVEDGAKGSRVMARKVSASGAAGPAIEVAQGSKQSLGYPRLSSNGNDAWIVWGDAKAGPRTALLK